MLTSKALCSLLALGFLGTACGSRAGSVKFQPANPLTLYSIDPAPIPKLMVRDRFGKPLEPQPAIQLSVAPAGILVVDRNELVPIRNGHVVLTAKVADSTIAASLPIEIRLIVRLEIKCATESCSHGVGEVFDMDAVPLTGEVPVSGVQVTWNSSDPRVAEPMPQPGRFRAVGPGKAEIIAGIASTRAARTVKVYAPADKLEIKCPPERAADGKRCSVMLGHSFKMLAEASGGGVAIDEPSIRWMSSSDEIATVDATGEVFGSSVGDVVISGKTGTASTSIKVSVFPKRELHPMCLGTRRYVVRDVPVYQEHWQGQSVVKVTMRCDTQKGAPCVLTQTRIAVPKMAELQEIADECCCKVESRYGY
jgi:hypothetical protein